MPDFTPARLPPAQALDEALAALYRKVEAEPIPQSFLRLVDQLEAASARLLDAERRTA